MATKRMDTGSKKTLYAPRQRTKTYAYITYATRTYIALRLGVAGGRDGSCGHMVCPKFLPVFPSLPPSILFQTDGSVYSLQIPYLFASENTKLVVATPQLPNLAQARSTYECVCTDVLSCVTSTPIYVHKPLFVFLWTKFNHSIIAGPNTLIFGMATPGKPRRDMGRVRFPTDEFRPTLIYAVAIWNDMY